jgi:hypothetical protein
MNKVKINIGKTPFEFWFGLGFFSRLKENQGIGIEKVQEGLADNAFKLVPILMLEAANYSATRRKVNVEYEVFDFIDALDDDGGISSPAFIKFMEALTESMTRDVPQEKTPAKKKVKPLK